MQKNKLKLPVHICLNKEHLSGFYEYLDFFINDHKNRWGRSDACEIYLWKSFWSLHHIRLLQRLLVQWDSKAGWHRRGEGGGHQRDNYWPTKHKYSHKAGVLRTLLNKGNPSCNVKTERGQINTNRWIQKCASMPLFLATNFIHVFHEPKLCKSAYFDRYSNFSLM